MKVIVCVCFSGPGGGSEMLCRTTKYAVAPVVGDLIELVPERKDEHSHVSEWHEPVARRYLHTSNTPRVEVHVELPRRELSDESRVGLLAAGYS